MTNFNSVDAALCHIVNLMINVDKAEDKNEELQALQDLYKEQEITIKLLKDIFKYLDKNANRTRKKIDELATVVENRSRSTDKYSRTFQQEEK